MAEEKDDNCGCRFRFGFPVYKNGIGQSVPLIEEAQCKYPSLRARLKEAEAERDLWKARMESVQSAEDENARLTAELEELKGILRKRDGEILRVARLHAEANRKTYAIYDTIRRLGGDPEKIVQVYEHDFQAWGIVADIAAKEPIEYEYGECVLCHGLGYENLGHGKKPHLPTCPWLRAKKLMEGK
jgi:hypothetical protein